MWPTSHPLAGPFGRCSESSVDLSNGAVGPDPVGRPGADQNGAVVDDPAEHLLGIESVTMSPDLSGQEVGVHRECHCGGRVVSSEFAEDLAHLRVGGAPAAGFDGHQGAGHCLSPSASRRPPPRSRRCCHALRRRLVAWFRPLGRLRSSRLLSARRVGLLVTVMPPTVFGGGYCVCPRETP